MQENGPLSDKIPAKALPTTARDRLAWLRLARSRRVGPATFIRLIRTHGSVHAALDALPGIAAAAGEAAYRPTSRDDAASELATGLGLGARLLCLGDSDYPPYLAMIGDPPPLLWALGDTGLATGRCVALVGARNASSLGIRMARKLASDLVEMGVTVVSGLARGIDGAAHTAALDQRLDPNGSSEASTIAVQAGGIDVMYPAENTDLAQRIAQDGLRLAEHPPGRIPQARHFPQRNRIISGLAQGVLVVEGAERSGSLITARNALDQGREVMAVPGHPMDPRANGCNQLITDGARLVRSASDVMTAMGWDGITAPTVGSVAASSKIPDHAQEHEKAGAVLEREVLNRLGPAPISEDALIRDMGAEPQKLLAALAELHLAGAVERHPGGLVSRAA